MKKFWKTYLLVTVITFAIVSPLYFGAYIIAPGSYASAEIYVVDIPYYEFKNGINDFKDKYPEYKTVLEKNLENPPTLDIQTEEDIDPSIPKYTYRDDSERYRLDHQYRDSIDNSKKIIDDDFISLSLPNINYTISVKLYKLDNNPSKSKVLLISASNIKNNYRGTINTKELSKEENNRVKKEFETQILNKLGSWGHEVPFFMRYIQSN